MGGYGYVPTANRSELRFKFFDLVKQLLDFQLLLVRIGSAASVLALRFWAT